MSKQITKANSRRALHAYLSDDAHEAWHEFAAENGVTVSGLLEAMTPHLLPDADGSTMASAWAKSVKQARAVDAQRRRRS